MIEFVFFILVSTVILYALGFSNRFIGILLGLIVGAYVFGSAFMEFVALLGFVIIPIYTLKYMNSPEKPWKHLEKLSPNYEAEEVDE
tara:strand:+ start:3421 stop:3681 length:261 start_codon:yes stop_codon:yes gene_type:complete